MTEILHSHCSVATSAGAIHAITQKSDEKPRDDQDTVLSRPPRAPASPTVASELFNRPQIDFIDFIRDEECCHYCLLCFGEHGTSAATMWAELRNSCEFHFFGVRAGKLGRANTAAKKALKDFAGRAYRGDGENRSNKYWRDVAGLMYQVYADLMARRQQTQAIIDRERQRIASTEKRRAAGAARAKRYRAKRRATRASQPRAASLPSPKTARNEG